MESWRAAGPDRCGIGRPAGQNASKRTFVCYVARVCQLQASSGGAGLVSFPLHRHVKHGNESLRVVPGSLQSSIGKSKWHSIPRHWKDSHVPIESSSYNISYAICNPWMIIRIKADGCTGCILRGECSAARWNSSHNCDKWRKLRTGDKKSGITNGRGFGTLPVRWQIAEQVQLTLGERDIISRSLARPLPSRNRPFHPPRVSSPLTLTIIKSPSRWWS